MTNIEPLRIGALLLDVDFMLAYLAGLGVLLLFCMERFNEPTNTGGSFVDALVPKALTDGSQYIRTFVIYVGILFFFYTVFSVLGPHLFAALGFVDPTAGYDSAAQQAGNVTEAQGKPAIQVAAWVPLAILLILTGGATHFRMLNQIELFSRRVAHRLIGIPQDVEVLARQIEDRRIALTLISETDQKVLLSAYNLIAPAPVQSMQQVAESFSGNDVQRRFVRLLFLYRMLEIKDLPAGFRTAIKDRYRTVWQDIGATVRDLRADDSRQLLALDVNELSKEQQGLLNGLVDRLDRALHDLHALISIGLWPYCKDRAKPRLITDAIGLVDEPIEDRTMLDRVVVGLFTLFLGVLGIVFLLFNDPLQAFVWATAAFSLHGAAAISAWRFYRLRSRDGSFVPLRLSKRQIPALQYFKVAGRGYLFGTAGLIAWYIVYVVLKDGALPRPTMALIWIPAYGTVGILTAFWIAYDFDLVHRQTASLARRVAQVAAQAVTTGATAYFVTISLQAAGGVITDSSRALALQIGIITALAALLLGAMPVFLAQRTRLEPDR